MKTYLFCYNMALVGRSNPQLLAFIKNNRAIQGWSSPFDGFVFFSSEQSVRELVDMFKEYFQGEVNYFIAHYDANGGGAVSKLTWDWLRDNVGSVTMLENET